MVVGIACFAAGDSIHPSGQAIAWKRPGLKAWATLWTEVGPLGLVARSRLLQDHEVADWLPLVTDNDEV